MKKLNYIIFAFLLPFSGFTQNSRAFYGSSVSRSYGVDTLAGFKAVNTNTLGYAGLVAISAADTSAFFTNGTGHASIYNSAGVLHQPQYVGVGGSPDVSGTAYLSLTGTAGGFLTARMTAAQKNAIGSPATGLLIYQTDGTPGFYYYTGSAWSAVGGGSSGITVGTTTITSGTTGSVLMDIGGIVTESASYRAQQATPFGTAFGFASMTGNTGVNNTAFGYNAGLGQTTGTDNIYLGWNAGFRNISGNRNIYLGGISGDVSLTNLSDNIFIGVGAGVHASAGANIVIGAGGQAGANLGIGNVSIGYQSMFNCSSSPIYNVSVGFWAGYAASGDGSVYLGTLAGWADNHFRAIGLGNQAIPSQDNELMIGGVDTYFGGTGATVGITNVCIGNGNTYTSAASVTIRVTSGSGSNNVGGNLTLAPGKSTGSATPGVINFQSTAAGASSSTAQTLATVLQITNSTTITTSDAVNYALGSTTGTKFGTATTQKLAFWNATPIVQPTTAVAAATFVANTSGIVDDSATFDGYTIGQVVKALRNAGLLQ